MQTPEGALKAKQTMIKKYGTDFYAKIGSVGGKNGRTGGFYNNPEAARKAGAKGGKISKRK
jgi:general stress protein YciG